MPAATDSPVRCVCARGISEQLGAEQGAGSQSIPPRVESERVFPRGLANRPASGQRGSLLRIFGQVTQIQQYPWLLCSSSFS